MYSGGAVYMTAGMLRDCYFSTNLSIREGSAFYISGGVASGPAAERTATTVLFFRPTGPIRRWKFLKATHP